MRWHNGSVRQSDTLMMTELEVGFTLGHKGHFFNLPLLEYD
jgi:hypothetical protein